MFQKIRKFAERLSLDIDSSDKNHVLHASFRVHSMIEV